MKHRDASLRKLNTLSSTLNKFRTYLNQGNREACYEVILEMHNQIEQIESYIESEPIAGNELNPTGN